LANENSEKGSIVGGVSYGDNRPDNSGIIVSLSKVNGVKSEFIASVVTDYDGNYAFYNLSSGTYTVYAYTSDGSESAISKDVVVSSNVATRLNWKNLESYGTVTGYVTKNETSSDNLGFLVFLAGTSFMAMTDSNGYYEIPEVPVGTYELCVSKGNLLYVSQSTVTTKKNKTVDAGVLNFTSKQISSGIVVESSENNGEISFWVCAEDISQVRIACGDYADIEEFNASANAIDVELNGRRTTRTAYANGIWTIAVSTLDGRSSVQTVEVTTVEKGIGDIIMSDGSCLSVANYASYTGSAFPVAVIVGSYDGRKLGLGVVNSGNTKYAWAPSGTTGYSKNFTDLSFTLSWDSSTNVNNWIGNIDGSDDWSVICAADSTASSNPATKYPAYNYALNYGTIAGLQNTPYASGWYIPTFVEVVYFYGFYGFDVIDYSAILDVAFEAVGINLTGKTFWLSNNVNGSATEMAAITYTSNVSGESARSNKAVGNSILVIREFD